MHGVWDQILDDEFVASYCHGFTMECLDGVWRRFYPRIFTYSADYPEKSVTGMYIIIADCNPTFHIELFWQPFEIMVIALVRGVTLPKWTSIKLARNAICSSVYLRHGLMRAIWFSPRADLYMS
jgi:hypothetical protein